MRCLPSLSSDGKRWRLPLSSVAAELLAECLLDPASAPATERVVRQLRADPALTLWMLCTANSQGEVPRTFANLARWFCNYVANQPPAEHLFAWDAEDLAFEKSTKVTHAAWRDVARRLTAASNRLLTSAEQHAEQSSHAHSDEASLVAWLFNYPQWFALSELNGLPAGHPPVPAWLSQEIADASSTSPHTPNTVGQSVREAIQERQQTGSDDNQSLSDIWSPSNSPWPRLLPQIAHRLTRLTELEHRFEEQLEIEKLEAMAELAAGAGHEINNPLAVISGRAQLMLRDEDDPGRKRTLASIHAQAHRVHEMISDLMLFGRPPELQSRTIDVLQLMEDLTTELSTVAESRRIRITTAAQAQHLWADADPVQLTVALRAITDNAVEAIGEGGQIHLEGRMIESASDHASQPVDGIEITIRDDGPGIAPDVRRHLFDPFFSGRSAGRGLGFGLTKCWQIVNAHGGQVEVNSEPGSGTEFRVTLPAVAQPTKPVIAGEAP